MYYLTGGNNSMSRFCKFGKLHVTKGNVDKLLGILPTTGRSTRPRTGALTASSERWWTCSRTTDA
ncbi:hypothetical protein [Thermophilibacter provencensis]|uniref:hypothetical protein n=1 Tax=Thermophilibacter provencensis TaxID=1852386 RepID=UPI003C705939